MSLIELLKKKKEQLQTVASRDHEFSEKLKDHPVEDNGLYRLHYMDFHRIGEYNGRRDNNIGIMDFPMAPFTLPENMNKKEAFRVLSYLSDYLEQELDIEPCSYKSVKTLDEMLRVPRLGFKHPNYYGQPFEGTELYTITGRIGLFKKSPEYQKYFEWYSEGVTREEVQQIYEKIGFHFEDLIPKYNLPKIEHNFKKI